MSLFKRGEIVDLSKTAEVQMELDKRLSRLENDAYLCSAIADGGKKIGTMLFKAGGANSLHAMMMQSIFSVDEKKRGITFGKIEDVRLFRGVQFDDNMAMMLRDWLLELYPLPAAKKGAKK